MGTKDTRAAHGAAAKKDMLLFNDDQLTLVTDEKHPLYDERVHLEPTEAMILNVMQYGVIEPVIVWKDPETRKTLIVDGRQRLKACREANKRIRKAGGEPHRISGITRRADAGTSVGLMISTNEQRIADTPLNLARKASRMLELGKTEAEVGVALGRAAGTVKNLIALLDAPAVVRHAVEQDKISISDGYKLAKLEPEEAKKKVEQLLKHAPRVPGRKRSPNAKKARAIVDGPSKVTTNGAATVAKDFDAGMRGFNQLENLQRELREASKSPARDAALAVVSWALGDDSLSFKELLGAVSA
jgi:ParB family transcriptional regulator, chromosome partitioning protein